MVSKYKDIEHKDYSAPRTMRLRVDGKWVYKRALFAPRRDFKQRHVPCRLATPAAALRYIPMASHPVAPTYHQMDRFISGLLDQGVEHPHDMAKRKYFPHRPKIEKRTDKNQARRARHRAWSQATETRSSQGRRPAPALVTNAAQVRAAQTFDGSQNVKYYRSICRDQATGRRNCSVSWSRPGGGDRECARRRRQMGTGEFVHVL